MPYARRTARLKFRSTRSRSPLKIPSVRHSAVRTGFLAGNGLPCVRQNSRPYGTVRYLKRDFRITHSRSRQNFLVSFPGMRNSKIFSSRFPECVIQPSVRQNSRPYGTVRDSISVRLKAVRTAKFRTDNSKFEARFMPYTRKFWRFPLKIPSVRHCAVRTGFLAGNVCTA